MGQLWRSGADQKRAGCEPNPLTQAPQRATKLGAKIKKRLHLRTLAFVL
jgi:hypothetical protein